MKKWFLAIVLCLGLTGCANFNPRLDEKIDNQNGKIDEIKNNQNGIMDEIGKLHQKSDIQSSNLRDMQQGYLNIQSHLFSRENNGVQILQGDGPLILIFASFVVGALIWYYRDESIRHSKAAEIMAQQIAAHGDEQLHEKVFQAAMYSPAEADIYHMITKYKPKS